MSGHQWYSITDGNWNATSTWSLSSGGSAGSDYPKTGDMARIEDGDTVTLTQAEHTGSVDLQSGGEIVGGGNILTLDSASIDDRIFIHAGTISAASALHVTLTGIQSNGDRAYLLSGGSGNITNLVLNDSGATHGQSGAMTLLGSFTITAGTWDTSFASSDYALTVTGATVVGVASDSGAADTATLTCNDSDISLGASYTSGYALKIFRGGTFNGGGGTHTSGAIRVHTDVNASAKLNFTDDVHTITSAYSDRFIEITSGTIDHNDGTIVLDNATSDYIQWYTGVAGHSGPFNLTLNDAGMTVRMRNPVNVLNDLTITAGTLSTHYDGADYKDLTVTGDVSIADGGTLTTGDAAISMRSLGIADGGTYNATSGTTTITGEGVGSGDYAWQNLETDGTGFVHNSGTVSLESTANTHVQESNFYNLIVNGNADDRVFTFRDSEDSIIRVYGNLTITRGELSFNTAGDAFTVHGLTHVAAIGKFDNDGATSGAHTFHSLVTNLGTYKTSSGTNNFNGGFRQLGTFVSNDTITINGSGGILEGNLDDAIINVNTDAVHTFDGADDYLLATSSKGDIEWSGNSFSITAWVYMTDSGKNVIASLVPSTSTNDAAIFVIDEDDSNHYNSLALAFKEHGTSSNDNTVGVTAAAKLHTNVWHHIAVTYNGSGSGTIGNYNFYIDGQLFDTGKSLLANDYSGRTDTLTANRVYIGRDKTEFFAGNMADIRLYDDVLTAPEVGEIASKINYESSSADNLIGRWKIAGSSIDLTDSNPDSSNAMVASGSPATKYDAFSVNVQGQTVAGTAKFVTDGTMTVTQGKLECLSLTSVDLDGANDYITTGNAFETIHQASFTWSAWFKPDDGQPSAQEYLLGSETDGNNHFYIALSTSGTLLGHYEADNDSANATTVTTLANGAEGWHHVTVSADDTGNTIKIFLNGVEEASSSISGITNADYAASQHFWIGDRNAEGNPTEPFAGDIRDVKLFDYALSADQAASLYSGSYNVTPAHWWKIDPVIADQSLTAAIEDYGTGTDSDGTGVHLGAWTNGTLDLDSSLTIAANGTLSAPRGTLDCVGNFSDAGTYTHNSGTFNFTAAANVSILGASNTNFYNLTSTATSASAVQMNNVSKTVIKRLDLINSDSYFDFFDSSGDTTLTMGDSSTQGTIDGGTSGRMRFRGSDTNQINIHGASSLYPAIFTGGQPNWDQSACKIHLKWVDVQLDMTTGTDSVITITLEGDCEFDAFTLSADDTLDLNGQRMECSGLFNMAGDFDADGLMLAHGFNYTSGTLTNEASFDFWQTGTKTGGAHKFSADVFRTKFFNGYGETNPSNIYGLTATNCIIAQGADGVDLDNIAASCTNLTIATGGTLECNEAVVTVAGDFTTSGGLLGASCLTLNGSSEHATATTANFRSSDTVGTIEAWFKSSDTDSTDQTIFSSSDTAGANEYVSMHLKSGDIYISITDGGVNDSAKHIGSWADGKWHHVAWVSDDSYWKLYIDGKQRYLTPIAWASADSLPKWFNDVSGRDNVSIGAFTYTSTASYFNGSLDEVRVWSTARTVTQIRDNMFTEVAAGSAGLVHQWSCNAGTGTTNAVVDTETGETDIHLTLNDEGGWAEEGDFDHGSASTLVMSGTSKTFNFLGGEDIYNLVINGTTTLNPIDSATSYLGLRGSVFTVGSSKTLSGAGYIRLFDEDVTLTFNTPATNIAGLQIGLQTKHSSGTLSIPEVTVPYVLCETSGGTTQATGDLTITTELEIESGTTFNANGNTIACKIVDGKSGGTLNLSNSTLNFSVTSSGDALSLDAGHTLTTGNTTITGYSSAGKTGTSVASAGDFEVVGDVKWLNIESGGDLTVVGAVVDCTGNIHQWHHTLDTQQLLDADSAGDDDLRLTKPALDNAHELMTG